MLVAFYTNILMKQVMLLLGIWPSHADYQRFLVEHVNRLFKHNLKSKGKAFGIIS